METSLLDSLPLDPGKGILAAARKLRATIDLHVEGRSNGRSGSMGTVLHYILAHIYLLEGEKLSQRPLQDLRAIYTEDQAKACGISYRNLALIVSCLRSMDADRGALPFGNEPRLADRATTMMRDAVRRHEAGTGNAGVEMRMVRLENVKQARHVLGLPQRGRSKDPAKARKSKP